MSWETLRNNAAYTQTAVNNVASRMGGYAAQWGPWFNRMTRGQVDGADLQAAQVLVSQLAQGANYYFPYDAQYAGQELVNAIQNQLTTQQNEWNYANNQQWTYSNNQYVNNTGYNYGYEYNNGWQSNGWGRMSDGEKIAVGVTGALALVATLLNS